MFDKNELLAGSDRKVEEIEAGGRKVLIRTLTAAEMLDYIEYSRTARGDGDGESAAVQRRIAARQLATFLGNPDGSAALTLEEADRVVAQYSSDFVASVVKKGHELSGLSKEEAEEIRKN